MRSESAFCIDNMDLCPQSFYTIVLVSECSILVHSKISLKHSYETQTRSSACAEIAWHVNGWMLPMCKTQHAPYPTGLPP